MSFACFVSVVFCFFFFKQKTAYEMRISDWSSDVCSSDLAIQQRLRLPDGALLGFTVFKRSYDARKKYADLSFVYTVDCELRDEAAVLAKFESDRNINPAPHVSYHPVASAPSGFGNRPIVIGFGPCGIFAALTLPHMGFRPIVLERGKDRKSTSL